MVIGETTRIGESVRFYQGVTLGAKSFSLVDDGNPHSGVTQAQARSEAFEDGGGI